MIIHDSNITKQSNNFDFIRLVAALLVLIGHSSYVLLNKPLSYDPVYYLMSFTIQTLGVVVFFVISGFLVAHSWERKKNVIDFMVARVLRIFPALIVVVLFSVFVVGIIFTTNDTNTYFTSPLTWSYFKNIVLYRIHYFLPGVFEQNPVGASLNGSLWSLPYEFTCYMVLMLFGVLSVLKQRWVMLVLFALFLLVFIVFPVQINRIVIPVLGIDFKNFYGFMLYFFAGVLYYYFRNKISISIWGTLVCVLIILLVKLSVFSNLVLVVVLPYLIFQFAFSKKNAFNNFGKYGDFSYGMYLYAFPVQQSIVYMLPFHISVCCMILISVVAVLPFAIASWYLIEKPALKLRSLIHITF